MVINAKKFSDVVLVYDQYYTNKPKPVLLILERVALCCGLCLCAMMFLLAEYRLQISPVLTGGMSLLFSASFSLLFVFVKKRFAIPAVAAIVGIVALFSREKIAEKIPYLSDAFWLLLDGRFVPGKVLVDHEPELLTPDNPAFNDAVTFGFLLVVFLFCIVTAACLSGKANIFPSLIVWILLWVPVLVSEKFTFSLWFIPALAMYMGAFVLTTVYGQGIALGRGLGGSYREAVVRSERSFSNSLARASYLKQVQMRTAYYSKYFSAVMYVMAVFAAIGLVAGTALSSSDGFDYTKLYDFVRSLGERSPITNPFDKGQSEEWFTDSAPGTNTHTQSLSIINPGRGNQRILSVKNTGNSVVYLRGDIGIDFTGENWTSPVSDEPKKWRDSGLSEYYRPVEVQVLRTLQGMLYSDMSDYSVNVADITVDYLCDSTVTFLPAYTSDFGYFDNEMFNIYGDFVARVDESYDRMDSVFCTALVPDYTNMDDSSSEAGLESIRRVAGLAKSTGGISGIIDGGYFFGHPQAFSEYQKYVRSTYLNVPPKYKAMISEYSATSGIVDKVYVIRSEEDDSIVESYRIASEVADYLRSNYTYSLDTNNRGENPLNSFLNVTKSGHCAMYASSMTLILREMGIPARYCTGFVVKPNGGEATVLRSKNLHAWVEVYLDELGWVTFDPTSSSQTGDTPGVINRPELPSVTSSSTSSESSSDESSEYEDENSDDESIDDDGEETNSSGDSNSNIPQNDNNDRIIMTIVIITVPCAIIAVALVCGAALSKKYDKLVKKAFKDARINGSCPELYAKISEIIKLCGLIQRPGEQPYKFFKRVDRHLKTNFAVRTNLLLKIAFSEGEFSRGELCETAALLESVYYAAKKQLVFIGLIKLNFIILKGKNK